MERTKRFSRYTMTEAKRKRWQKEGRGTGVHENYRPWLYKEDVPSTGRVNSIASVWLNRSVEVLSRNEEGSFLLYEYALKPKTPLQDLSKYHNDIREQYPMNLDETVAIAKSIGVDHPKDPISGVLVVMTTDFMITYQGEDFARTVKEENDLGNPRTIEKLEIERIYWGMKNIDWGIILKKDIPQDFVANLEAVRNYYDILSHSEIQNQGINPVYLKKISNYLTGAIQGSLLSLREICADTDLKYGLSDGTSLLIAKHLIYTQQWDIDLMKALRPGDPVILKNINLI